MTGEKRKFIAISVSFITLLGLAVYFNSLNGEFIWDDLAFVERNEFIKDWGNASKLFSKDASKSLSPDGGGVKYNFYRPLHILTLMADYSLWGLNTFGYHLTNAIFHILAALLIFWFITILFDDWILSFIAASLFLVHPIHVEAVAFISGRADPLSLIFVLLSIIFYIKTCDNKNYPFLIFSLLSFILAILSRENSVILPLVLLIYHYSFRKRIKPLPFISISAIALLYLIFRLSMAKELLAGENIPSLSGAIGRVPGFFVALFNYLRILLIPLGLHMEYGNPLFAFTEPRAIIGGVVFVILIIYTIRKREKRGIVFFSITWFFICLMPSANILPIGAYMAEHWLYLPSIGFFLLIAKGLARLYESKSYRALGAGILILLLAFYSFLTVRQNIYWNKLIPFYERTLAFNPESPRLLNNLAVAYHDNKEYDKAIRTYKKAINIDPRYFETFCNLGTVYHDAKEYRKSEEAYKREIAINPDYPKVYNNLGALYNDLGRFSEAIEAYKTAIELKPGQMEMYFNLALAYQNTGKYKEAIQAYKKAIEIDPDFANAHHDLGVTYHKAGKHNEAVRAYKEAIKKNPNEAEMYSNLGIAYLVLNEKDKAIASYKKALEIDRDHAASHNSLAIIYFQKGEHKLASEHCDKALELGYPIDSRFLEDLKKER